MAVYVNDNAYLSVGGAPLSEYVKSAQITVNGEIQDTSAMGSTWRKRIGGVTDWKLDVEWYADFDPAKTYHTLAAALNTSTAIIYRPDAGVIAPANPEWTGTALLEELAVGGAWGETAMFTSSFLGDGGGAPGWLTA